MFHLPDGPTEQNLFAFYDGLITVSSIQIKHEYAMMRVDWNEGAVDGDLMDYFVGKPPDVDNFYKYISKEQTRRLFKEIELKADELEEHLRNSFLHKIGSKINYFIHKIQVSKLIIESLEFAEDLEILKNDIAVRFPENSQSTSLLVPEQNQKIRWTGTINQLATLFFDLWKGQEKIKGETSRPMIDTNKTDLMNFLINNFLVKTNENLKSSTLNDYLNQSKPETRAKEGVRIELQIPNQ